MTSLLQTEEKHFLFFWTMTSVYGLHIQNWIIAFGKVTSDQIPLRTKDVNQRIHSNIKKLQSKFSKRHVQSFSDKYMVT